MLYARGYHCGVIPVDSGMVARLAPCLGIRLPASPLAHELRRKILQSCASADSAAYRQLIGDCGYYIAIPPGSPPSWWLHLVLIYFKRLYLNPPVNGRLCPRRPTCVTLIDCAHVRA